MKFKLKSEYQPSGDQPRAIEQLVAGIEARKKFQTLLGVTGSGKTFTIANVIARFQRPVLVISHNKTLVAQLYAELKEFFPENAVEYFVSYFDYYQPEAYVPHTDTYIEKDSSINDDIDRLRLRATSSLLSRRDCILVSSVSCIYGLGSPQDYERLLVFVRQKETVVRDELLRKLVTIQYERNDIDFARGKFRVHGDVVDVFLAYEEKAVRIELEYDVVRDIFYFDPTSGQRLTDSLECIAIYPAKHYVTTEDRLKSIFPVIERELEERVEWFKAQNKYLEAQRILQRTRYDLEMMEALGYCSGIENYSRYLTGRMPGEKPYCLLDYFPKDFLIIIDESHVTLPQIRGMYHGDRARKETLVEHGFRLPSALDNRPLKFDEFEGMIDQMIFVSATPGDYEIKHSRDAVEQLLRPTGLLDPSVEIRPTQGQIDDLVLEVEKRAKAGERTLVTTLTKRMAEDLARYLSERGMRVKYLHSEIETLERVEILQSLRQDKFDCLVGINLLREGLDLPEVSLVAILDADKEGFLRSRTSLIQTAGRAARHVHGHVILYADRVTDSMQALLVETNRRRAKQQAYNEAHHIIPVGVQKPILDGILNIRKVRDIVQEATGLDDEEFERHELLDELERQMQMHAANLQFEKAIELRNKIEEMKKRGEGRGERGEEEGAFAPKKQHRKKKANPFAKRMKRIERSKKKRASNGS